MCGIVAAIAQHNIVPVLIEGLNKLEYRGYDSDGLAIHQTEGLQRLRSVGRVADLARQCQDHDARAGITHTRWATHGAPCEKNARPHVSGSIAVFHNGIIENYETLRADLQSQGYHFTSETDTETIAHLIEATQKKTTLDLYQAVRLATQRLMGAYVIAVIDQQHPDRIIVAREGSPLLLGVADHGHYAASDASALLQVTRRLVYLENGDLAELTQDQLRITNAQGRPVTRPDTLSELTADAVDLGPYRRFMQKETFEQPSALANTLETVSTGHHVPPEILGAQAKDSLVGINQILILACGTSHHDGQVTRYWMEDLHSISTQVKIASEYRYRASDANHHQLVVTIYQSCENADTLAARRHLPYAIQKILALEPKIQAWAKHFADKTTASTWAWAGTTSSSWKAPSNSKKSSTSTPCLPRRRIHTQPPSPHRQANARHRRRPQ